MMTDVRIVYRLDENTWKLTTLQQLVVGDMFKMFEPDDMTPVTHHSKDIFMVTRSPELIGGIWGVEVE